MLGHPAEISCSTAPDGGAVAVNRRGEDQLIADLQAKIENLKARAATKAAKKDPTFRYVSKAIKSIDAALSATSDQALRGALQEARVTLSACMQLKGVLVPQNGRASSSVNPDGVIHRIQDVTS